MIWTASAAVTNIYRTFLSKTALRELEAALFLLDANLNLVDPLATSEVFDIVSTLHGTTIIALSNFDDS